MVFKSMKTALTIAGSDSSGGAGIQADLKTFASHRVFGKSVITSITFQNTAGVSGTRDLPRDAVEGQLKAVLEDGVPGAVKTGMLGNEELVEAVADGLRRYRIKKLVVDPVIESFNGKRLLSRKGVELLKARLLPMALLVTPNLKEAEILSGIRIKNLPGRLKAAKAILKLGPRGVLIKGGHLKGNPEDFFYNGGKPVLLESDRISRQNIHGTGCVLSAAITASLAKGQDLLSSIVMAKEFIGQAIAGGVLTGKGIPCVEPLVMVNQNCERYELLQRTCRAVELLKANRIGKLIPEVQSNLGAGLEGAVDLDDVIGIPGRIIKKGEDIATLAFPEFGGSRHVADIVLTVMKFDPSKRAVMNIKFDDELIRICKKLRFKIASFDRQREPRKVKVQEGSSLEWGTATAIRSFGSVPDIIFDRGGVGKEEMIRVIASDVESLVEKVLKINRLYRGR